MIPAIGARGLVLLDLHGGRAWTEPSAVVLKSTADAIGLGHIERNVVELAARDRVEVVPVLASVERLRGPTVRPDDNVAWVGGGDKDCVMVRVQEVREPFTERLSPIVADLGRPAEHIHALRVLGAELDLAKVERPWRPDAPALPSLASVG